MSRGSSTRLTGCADQLDGGLGGGHQLTPACAASRIARTMFS